jgi:hypothetical protein
VQAEYIGLGDVHKTGYDGMEFVVPFYDRQQGMRLNGTEGQCLFSFHIYPTSNFESVYKTSLPLIVTFVLGATFVAMLSTFIIYDCFVSHRNMKVLDAATRTQVLVSSMFPAAIQDRMFAAKQEQSNKKAGKNRLSSFLSNTADHYETSLQSKPIADLFTETTILFADIAGFTAWSSSREPCQVSLHRDNSRRS